MKTSHNLLVEVNLPKFFFQNLTVSVPKKGLKSLCPFISTLYCGPLDDQKPLEKQATLSVKNAYYYKAFVFLKKKQNKTKRLGVEPKTFNV